MKDKTHLKLTCGKCGDQYFRIITQPPMSSYDIVCDACGACCAHVDSYALHLIGEEDNNVNETP